VVEFAQIIAGPIAGTLLADLGAEVIHVEDPVHGDPARTNGPMKDGVGLWWKVAGRNKRNVTLDLRTEAGQAVARDLVRWSDVVITNFRAATVRGWGLDFASLQAIKPDLIMLHITGYGLETSMENAPGLGKVGEARSGVVHVTGFADGPPVHTGFSHADTVTGLMGAFGILAAVRKKEVDPEFTGELIDLALYEGLFRLIEWQVVTYDQLGLVPDRAGNQLAVAPGAVVNTYLSRDGVWITVTSATLRSVQRVGALLGMDPAALSTIAGQLEQRDTLDGLLREWIGDRDADACLEAMSDTGVVASRIFSVKDIFEDEVYAERGDIVTVEDPQLGPLRMQAVVPRLHKHGGAVWKSGGQLGEDNSLVYSGYLGLTDEQVDVLRAAGTI
jgi:formyl-CoA transferase